jgi:hypothetical protein
MNWLLGKLPRLHHNANLPVDGPSGLREQWGRRREGGRGFSNKGEHMTVSELREKLLEFPQDMLVAAGEIPNDCYLYTECINVIKEVLVKKKGTLGIDVVSITGYFE